MRLGIIGIAAIAILFLPIPRGESLMPPPGANHEAGSTTSSAKDEPLRWKSEWTMDRQTASGRATVHFTEKGSGRYSPFAVPVRWSTETIWMADGSFRPLTIDRTVTDLSGRQLLKERKSFDFGKGVVEIETINDSNKTPSRKSLTIPSDTLTVDGIAAALRSLPFEQSRAVELHLLSNEPKLYEVSFEIQGRERIRTAAGEFECYKVELRPSLGVLSVFRFLIPKAYFWFTAAAPHHWVRYEGPENGPGTPQIAMELVTFTQSN